MTAANRPRPTGASKLLRRGAGVTVRFALGLPLLAVSYAATAGLGAVNALAAAIEGSS